MRISNEFLLMSFCTRTKETDYDIRREVEATPSKNKSESIN